MFPTIFSVVDNPFDKTTPDISILGVKLTSDALAALGAAWGLGMLVLAGFLVKGIVNFGRAKRVSHNPEALSDASKSIFVPLIAIACLAGVGTLFGAAAGLFG